MRGSLLGVDGDEMKEADVIRVIKDYLQIQRNQKKLMYIRNNSGAMPIIDGKNKRRYIRFGDKGSPDFLVWKPVTAPFISEWVRPRAIALEAKSDTGKQSKGQKEWQKDFEAIGGEYYIVRCLEDVIKIIG